MSTTLILASQVMDRAAILLNDPNKTDYNYAVMLPYLNLAIEEFCDISAESNSPFMNLTNLNTSSTPIIVPAGIKFLVPADYPLAGTYPTYTLDLIEIQEIGERPAGSSSQFTRLERREFGENYPPTRSLRYWVWERGIIVFNMNGASIDIEVQLKFIYQGVPYAANENSQIVAIGARTYLAYRTAAFCAMFIGENETRAQVLENAANQAMERAMNISNKGRQEIMTRHRPFRAGYKSRSGM